MGLISRPRFHSVGRSVSSVSGRTGVEAGASTYDRWPTACLACVAGYRGRQTDALCRCGYVRISGKHYAKRHRRGPRGCAVPGSADALVRSSSVARSANGRRYRTPDPATARNVGRIGSLPRGASGNDADTVRRRPRTDVSAVSVPASSSRRVRTDRQVVRCPAANTANACTHYGRSNDLTLMLDDAAGVGVGGEARSHRMGGITYGHG